MPFEAGHATVDRILRNKYEDALAGAPRRWSLKTGTPLSDQIDEDFGSAEANEALEGLRSSAGGMPIVASRKHAARIAWLNGCVRDLRAQYACGRDCRPCASADIRRVDLEQLTRSIQAHTYLKIHNEAQT